jgi:hypothetical protein
MLTHALLPGSPAIDAGDPMAAAGMDDVPLYDQRGTPFSRVANGDDIPEARIDIGAFEWQANPLAGDYNYSGVVDASDYVLWRKTLGSTMDLRADGDGDADVDQDDYLVWRSNFGAVAPDPPEASAVTFSTVGSSAATAVASEPSTTSGDNGSVTAPKRTMPLDTPASAVFRRTEPFPVATKHANEAAAVNDEALIAWLAGMDGAVRMPQPSGGDEFSEERVHLSPGSSPTLDDFFALEQPDGL